MNKRDFIERDLDDIYLAIRLANQASVEFAKALAKADVDVDHAELKEFMENALFDLEKQKVDLERERAIVADKDSWSEYYGSVM